MKKLTEQMFQFNYYVTLLRPLFQYLSCTIACTENLSGKEFYAQNSTRLR